VKTQLNYAIITYYLVLIVGKQLKMNRKIYKNLQIPDISLLDETPVK